MMVFYDCIILLRIFKCPIFVYRTVFIYCAFYYQEEQYLAIREVKELIPLTKDFVYKKIFSASTHPKRYEFLMQHITGDSSIEVLSAAANELPAYWINAKKMILDEPVHCKNQGLANIEMQVKAQNYTGARSYLYMAGMSMLQYSVKRMG